MGEVAGGARPATKLEPSGAGGEDATLREVREGLERRQKELPSKYFYDRRGSELFERITLLPEYYATRTELGILRERVRPWVEEAEPATLVELGAGSGRKTRILLDGMVRVRSGAVYAPVDVSAEFLRDAAERMREAFPALRVEPLVADMTDGLRLDSDLPRPAVFALLGSTIGNFPPPRDRELLRKIRRRMEPGDAFLMGADLKPGPGKPVERVEEAYNDAAGVTARFNLNVLRVLNRELGLDFDEEAFEHRAFYAREHERIEMHLVSRSRQRVVLPDGTEVEFEAGESVRTEVSCKYDREAVAALFADAGLELERWFPDPDGWYAVALGRPEAG